MEFKKYNTIENAYRKKTIDYFVAKRVTNDEFVVQEKAHGANLSFWYDGNELKSAKRSGFINDDFYNYQPVEKEYQGRLKQLYTLLNEIGYRINVLVVYGELIGGTYPHEEVKKNTSSTIIQKGVYYSPTNEFYAFDVSVNGDLLNIDTFNRVMEETNFLYAKPIFRGTFNECLKYTNEFPSKIPGWLGLPEIKYNICEGIVIKPIRPMFFDGGSRVILKSKNEIWSERAQKRDIVKKEMPTLSEAGKKLYSEIELLITENRLCNVLSKTGSIAQEEFGKLLYHFSQDILNDFHKDYSDAYNAIEKKEQKQLTKQLNRECSKLIRFNFQNIIDGNF